MPNSPAQAIQDSAGNVFLLSSPLDVMNAREEMLQRDPAMRDLSFEDLHPLVVREVANQHGIDIDQMVRRGLQRQDQDAPEPDQTYERDREGPGREI